MYSVDARFGRLLENFGEQGVLRALNNALEFKYPGKYPRDLDATTIGYSMRTPPAFFNNTLYFGLALGDSHIPGGLVMAQVWYAEVPGTTNTGNLVTAGDVVFQGIGNGDFYAFDARSGRQLFKTTVKSGIRASSLTYQVDGKQYVSVVGGNMVFAFGLP